MQKGLSLKRALRNWLKITTLNTYCVVLFVFQSCFIFFSCTDSESEETVQVKNAKKQAEKLPLSSKPGKILRQDPVTYISETGKGTEYMYCFIEKQCVLYSWASHWCLNVPPSLWVEFVFPILLCWIIVRGRLSSSLAFYVC